MLNSLQTLNVKNIKVKLRLKIFCQCANMVFEHLRPVYGLFTDIFSFNRNKWCLASIELLDN